MILLIIAIILLLIFVPIFIIGIKESDDGAFAVGLSLIMITLVVVPMLIGWVGYGKVNKKYLEEKEKIEYQLDKKDKYFFTYLSDAENHNKGVNIGNNIFFRFKKEDRSEYMIDIEYYKSTLIKGDD